LYCTFEQRDINVLSLVVIKENCNELSLRLTESGGAQAVDFTDIISPLLCGIWDDKGYCLSGNTVFSSF